MSYNDGSLFGYDFINPYNEQPIDFTSTTNRGKQVLTTFNEFVEPKKKEGFGAPEPNILFLMLLLVVVMQFKMMIKLEVLCGQHRLGVAV